MIGYIVGACISVVVAFLSYFLVYDKAPALEQATTDPNDPANEPIAVRQRERERNNMHAIGIVCMVASGVFTCIFSAAAYSTFSHERAEQRAEQRAAQKAAQEAAQAEPTA